MSTDFRALCAELLMALENAVSIIYCEDGTKHISTAKPIVNRARAALADEPAEPEGREWPSDEELLDLHDWMADEWAANHDAELPLSQYARAVLTRWGHQPAPPADGEVAELVAWLRETGDTIQPSHLAEHQRYKRAAELLERQVVVPVAVSVRLPGAEETTEDGEVWIGDPGHDYPLADTGDYDWEPHRWVLRQIGKFDAKNNLHWLPAHALPLPEVNNG